MSQEIQEAVYKQQEVIKDKQLSVKQDLDQVEPAVIEAQNGMVVQFVVRLLFIKEHDNSAGCYKYDFFLFPKSLHGSKGFWFTMQSLTSSSPNCPPTPFLVIIHPLFI